ncbi:hypothetical protein Ciccas_009126 [Cichlidogyrus casuarinus]|uniref:FBXO47 ARM repeats region domain-containing protein n=1 Tax=Cichlidogyrus casuarinus TaxID=1844966 RepID=A0ABD2PYW7_9PLAT
MYAILHQLKKEEQARLLFILYGPLHRGKLIWNMICENTAADFDQLKHCFGEFGAMLSFLTIKGTEGNFLCHGTRAKNHAMQVFDWMISEPADWLVENIACVIYAAGWDFMKTFLVFKAINLEIGEIVALLTSLCLLLVKIKEDVSRLLDLMRCVLDTMNKDKRYLLIDQLSSSFNYVFLDMQPELNDRQSEFLFVLEAQASFLRALLVGLFDEKPLSPILAAKRPRNDRELRPLKQRK